MRTSSEEGERVIGVEVSGLGVYRFRGAGIKKWVWQSLVFFDNWNREMPIM